MKKSKKLLSVLLAFVMVLSAVAATFAASAADAYKPAYSEDVTEQDIADLIGDINTILNDQLLTGASIESIYKVLPQLKSIIMISGSSNASDQAAFYKAGAPERFADLPDGTIVADVYDAETGELTTPGTFTTFFKENPIVVEKPEDFQAELNLLIDMIVQSNLLDTLAFVAAMANTAPTLGDGIDDICAALGVEQTEKFSDVCGFNQYITLVNHSVEGTRTYLKNIVAALFPDTANSAISMIQRVTIDENGALLYSGLNKVLSSLSKVIEGLESYLGTLIDVEAVKVQIEEIKASFDALPTVGEGDAKRLDIEGTVSALIMSLTDNALAIAFVNNKNDEAPSTGATVTIKFSHMKLERVQEAESNADVVKIIYDYLYNNLIADTANNTLIWTAVNMGILETALGIKLDSEVKAFINDALKMSNDELMEEAIVAAANAAGRELPQPEETTTEEDTTETTTEEDTTKPTTEEDTTETTTKADTVKDVNIPKTGKSVATVGFALVSLAAAAGMIVIARKKGE